MRLAPAARYRSATGRPCLARSGWATASSSLPITTSARPSFIFTACAPRGPVEEGAGGRRDRRHRGGSELAPVRAQQRAHRGRCRRVRWPAISALAACSGSARRRGVARAPSRRGPQRAGQQQPVPRRHLARRSDEGAADSSSSVVSAFNDAAPPPPPPPAAATAAAATVAATAAAASRAAADRHRRAVPRRAGRSMPGWHAPRSAAACASPPSRTPGQRVVARARAACG